MAPILIQLFRRASLPFFALSLSLYFFEYNFRWIVKAHKRTMVIKSHTLVENDHHRCVYFATIIMVIFFSNKWISENKLLFQLLKFWFVVFFSSQLHDFKYHTATDGDYIRLCSRRHRGIVFVSAGWNSRNFFHDCFFFHSCYYVSMLFWIFRFVIQLLSAEKHISNRNQSVGFFLSLSLGRDLTVANSTRVICVVNQKRFYVKRYFIEEVPFGQLVLRPV